MIGLGAKLCKEQMGVLDSDLHLNADFNTSSLGKVLRSSVPLVPNLSSVAAKRHLTGLLQDNTCEEPAK